MNTLEGIIKDVEKCNLVSNKIIDKVRELIGQEKWNELYDEYDDTMTTTGELLITLKSLKPIEEDKSKVEKKASEYAAKILSHKMAIHDCFTKETTEKELIAAYIAGAKENGIVFHNLQTDPEDLPKCEENKRILFYVKEWYENIQKHLNHYCLGFYKKSFMNDDVKLFTERSKGYENEHLPQTVLFWAELPQFTGE